jgi:hypothetical protein
MASMTQNERAAAEACKPPGLVCWFSGEQSLNCHFLVESYLKWLQLSLCKLLRLHPAAYFYLGAKG